MRTGNKLFRSLLVLPLVLLGCASLQRPADCPPCAAPRMENGASYKDLVVCGETEDGPMCVPFQDFMEHFLKRAGVKIVVPPDTNTTDL